MNQLLASNFGKDIRMNRPKTVLLDTSAVLGRFRDYVGDYLCEGSVEDSDNLVNTIVSNVCALLEEWETADLFIGNIAEDLLAVLGLDKNSAIGAANTKSVHEIALDVIQRVSRADLVDGGLLYYDYSKMHNDMLVMKSTI